MTSDEIRAFITRHVQAWSRHDVAALMEHYADDCEVVSPLFRILRGKAEVEAAFRDLFRIFEALAIHVDDVLIDHESGDRVVYMCTITVTHRGEVLGFPGTGRRFPVKGVFMVGFKNGRIASERRLYDLTEVMLQIGS
jgi:steroid delta-isomerase-like uncharacterized protein